MTKEEKVETKLTVEDLQNLDQVLSQPISQINLDIAEVLIVLRNKVRQMVSEA